MIQDNLRKVRKDRYFRQCPTCKDIIEDTEIMEKAKLSQHQKDVKEELNWLKRFRVYCYEKGFSGGCIWIDTEIKQLQEEIKK